MQAGARGRQHAGAGAQAPGARRPACRPAWRPRARGGWRSGCAGCWAGWPCRCCARTSTPPSRRPSATPCCITGLPPSLPNPNPNPNCLHLCCARTSTPPSRRPSATPCCTTGPPPSLLTLTLTPTASISPSVYNILTATSLLNSANGLARAPHGVRRARDAVATGRGWRLALRHARLPGCWLMRGRAGSLCGRGWRPVRTTRCGRRCSRR